MNLSCIARYSGIAFLVAGDLVIVALVIWWLLTSYWVALSLIDSVGFLSPHAAASSSVFLSESDVFYFILAEMPLYGLMFTLGGLAILPGLIRRMAQKRDSRMWR